MKYFISFLVSLAFIACSKHENSVNNFDLIISNVNLIDGTGEEMQFGVNVYIKNGRIAEIDSSEIEQKKNIVDGSNKYLIPGLFDCHIHTTDYKKDFASLMHYGVTSVFIPGGSLCTNEYFAEMRAIGYQDSIPAPRVFHTSQHFTMEGRHPAKTYASSNWRDSETIFFLKDTSQISRLVKKVAQYPIMGIKVTIEDGPAPPFVERIPQEFVDKIVEETEKYDLEVYAHASDNVEFLMAVNSGARNLIHFVGIELDWENEEHVSAVNSLLERNGNIVTTLMIDKSFIYPLNQEWLSIKELNEAYPQEELQELITPESMGRAKRIANQTKEEYNLEELNLETIFLPKVSDVRELLNRGMNICLGTDAGNSFNFHGYSLHEEMQIMEMGGIKPMDIIKMGTYNAALMMKAEDSLGTIEVGKLADFVLLDANPLESINNTLKINTVFKNGRVQKRLH